MVIKELYLKHFGKFTDARFELSEGIQVFYGENEYGKSTVYAFIKAMLFGLERGRGRAAQKDEFSRYEPWENPNYYAGMMRFCCGRRTFRLEREFDRYGKRAALICEDDGEELSVEDGDLDMLLGGMTAASFENAAAIGQLTAQPGQGLAVELKNCAANYYETGSGEVDFHGTMECLKEKKRAIGQKMKAIRQEQEQEAERLRIQQQYVKEELQKLERELQESRRKEKEQWEIQRKQKIQMEQEQMEQERETQRKQREQMEQRKGIRRKQQERIEQQRNYESGQQAEVWKRIFRMLLGVFLVGGVIGSLVVLLAHVSLVLFLVCWCAFFLGSCLSVSIIRGMRRGGKTQSWNKTSYDNPETRSPQENPAQPPQESPTQSVWQNPARSPQESPAQLTQENPVQIAQEKLQEIQERVQRTAWLSEQVQSSMQDKQIQFRNLQEQIEEQTQPGDVYRRLTEKQKALDLAMERLSQAARQMTQAFGARLNRETSRILSEITDGACERVLVEDNLELSVIREGRKISVERLSRGMMEQVYFALRMAALNLLYTEEEMPVIFDDAFVYYDEKRLKSTLKWLSEQQRQVIIFSCQMREKEIVKQF